MHTAPTDDVQGHPPISAMGMIHILKTVGMMVVMLLVPLVSLFAFAGVFTLLHEGAHYLAITACGHHADLELGRWFSWGLSNHTNYELVSGQPTPFWLFLGAPYFLWMGVTLIVLALFTWWPSRFLNRFSVALPLMILSSGAGMDTVANVYERTVGCDPMRVASIYGVPGTIGVVVVLAINVLAMGLAYCAFVRRFYPDIKARLLSQPPVQYLDANRERAIRFAVWIVFIVVMFLAGRNILRDELTSSFGSAVTSQAFVTVLIAVSIFGFLWFVKMASKVILFGEFPASNLGRSCHAGAASGMLQDMLPIHAERVAVHEAGHALILAALDRVWPNTTVSIVPNQASQGRIHWRPSGTVTPEALTWSLYMHLGGMAAGTALDLETIGAGDDIRQWEDSIRPSLLQRCTGFFAQPASPAEAEHNATVLAKLRREHLDVLAGFFAANTTVLRELADLLIMRKAIGLDELRPFLDRVDTAPLGLGRINLDHLILYQTTADRSAS